MTKILVIEDHVLVREAMSQTLMRLEDGVQCVGVKTADEALSELERDPDRDLAVVDLMLPDINGFSLLGILAKRFPEVPAIVVSALALMSASSAKPSLNSSSSPPSATEIDSASPPRVPAAMLSRTVFSRPSQWYTTEATT